MKGNELCGKEIKWFFMVLEVLSWSSSFLAKLGQPSGNEFGLSFPSPGADGQKLEAPECVIAHAAATSGGGPTGSSERR